MRLLSILLVLVLLIPTVALTKEYKVGDIIEFKESFELLDILDGLAIETDFEEFFFGVHGVELTKSRNLDLIDKDLRSFSNVIFKVVTKDFLGTPEITIESNDINLVKRWIDKGWLKVDSFTCNVNPLCNQYRGK